MVQIVPWVALDATPSHNPMKDPSDASISFRKTGPSGEMCILVRALKLTYSHALNFHHSSFLPQEFSSKWLMFYSLCWCCKMGQYTSYLLEVAVINLILHHMLLLHTLSTTNFIPTGYPPSPPLPSLHQRGGGESPPNSSHLSEKNTKWSIWFF